MSWLIGIIRNWFSSCRYQPGDPLVNMQFAAEHKAAIRAAEEAMHKSKVADAWAADIERHRPLTQAEEDKLERIHTARTEAVDLAVATGERRTAAL